jgi:urease accessory protein
MSSSALASRAAIRAIEPRQASQLKLRFEKGPDGRSFLAHQYADYPYHICRAQYFDAAPAGMATLYLQSCSGGLFENDRLNFNIIAGAGTAVHITNQASTIVHSARGPGMASHRGTIIALPGSFVEYLPEPTILFPDSRLEVRLDLQVGESASIMVCDSFLLHDPSGKGAVPALLDASLNATLVDGTLIARDRMRIAGSTWEASQPGAFGEWKCQGIILVLTSLVASNSLCSEIRNAISSMGDLYAGVTTLSQARGICARFLSRDAVPLKAAMTAAWKATRKLLCGLEPAVRRK